MERSIFQYDRSDHKRKLKLIQNGPCIDCLIWPRCQNQHFTTLLRECLPLCEYWSVQRNQKIISRIAKRACELHFLEKAYQIHL